MINFDRLNKLFFILLHAQSLAEFCANKKTKRLPYIRQVEIMNVEFTWILGQGKKSSI